DALAAGLQTNAVALPCDVTDSAAVREAVANAGVGATFAVKNFNLEEAKRMVDVNVIGMMVLFDAVIPKMIGRRSGHFAGVASLAGLRGLPTAAVYSATKAAMQAFLEGMRVELRRYGVAVTTINPGFVVSEMTDQNKFRMPFLM